MSKTSVFQMQIFFSVFRSFATKKRKIKIRDALFDIEIENTTLEGLQQEAQNLYTKYEG